MKKIITKIYNSNEFMQNAQKTKFKYSLLITQKPSLKKKKQRVNLEIKLKHYEGNINSKENRNLYITIAKMI